MNGRIATLNPEVFTGINFLGLAGGKYTFICV